MADWRILGASATGVSHARAGQPCQDAHGICRLPGGRVLMAAADGAGSAERSGEGAHTAVTVVLDFLATALAADQPGDASEWQLLYGYAYERARQAIERLAENAGLPARAFATTLLCASLSDAGLATAQVGDGLAIVADSEGAWHVAAAPQRGEYANETHFLTQPDLAVRLEAACWPGPLQAAVVMTDGLMRLVLDMQRGTPHAPFFEPLLAFAAGVNDEAEGGDQLGAFLNSERVNARTDDDKTLVMAVRR
jgi:hypothetical protein